MLVKHLLLFQTLSLPKNKGLLIRMCFSFLSQFQCFIYCFGEKEEGWLGTPRQGIEPALRPWTCCSASVSLPFLNSPEVNRVPPSTPCCSENQFFLFKNQCFTIQEHSFIFPAKYKIAHLFFTCMFVRVP